MVNMSGRDPRRYLVCLRKANVFSDMIKGHVLPLEGIVYEHRAVLPSFSPTLAQTMEETFHISRTSRELLTFGPSAQYLL